MSKRKGKRWGYVEITKKVNFGFLFKDVHELIMVSIIYYLLSIYAFVI